MHKYVTDDGYEVIYDDGYKVVTPSGVCVYLDIDDDSPSGIELALESTLEFLRENEEFFTCEEK